MSGIENAENGAVVEKIEAPAPVSSDATAEQTQDQKERDDKGRFVPQERVNEITRARRQAERERDELRQQLEFMRSQTPQPQQQAGIPDPSELGWDLQQWGKALTENVSRTAYEQAQAQIRQEQQQAYEAQLLQQFEAREQAFAAQSPDYFDRVQSLMGTVTFTPAVGEILATSDHGPAVLDYLAQHLDEADRISRLPPHMAAAQIGRIEAKVSAPKAKPASNAPAPVPTLGGGARSTKPVGEMTYEEYKAYRQQSN
jgi:hypothetical protein